MEYRSDQTKIINMISEPQSRALINNPERQPQRQLPYKIIAIEGDFFRVLLKELLCHRALVRIWAVFWSFITLTLGLLIFSSIYETGSLPVLSLFVLGAITQSVFCYLSRKNINKMILPLSLVFLLFVAILFSLVVCGIRYTIAPCLIFSVTLLVFTIIHAKNKGKVVLLMFVLAQVSLVAAKVDGLIKMEWSMVMIPLLPVALLSSLALVFLVIYTVLLKYTYIQTFKIKKYSLLFLLTSLFGINCLESVIMGWAYLDLSQVLTSAIALCGTSTIAVYLWLDNEKIALAFCRHKERITEDDKELKVELIPKKLNPTSFLYRYSSTWFGREEKDVEEIVETSQLPECIICTQEQSSVIWLPCGHLSLCSPCSQDMLASKMLSCVLCKQKPVQICKISLPSNEQVSLQREMGLIKEQKHKNKYTITQLYEIKLVL